MHTNSKLLFEKYGKPYFRTILNSNTSRFSKLRVLEIGPDNLPSTYQKIVGDKYIDWDTIDIYKRQDLTFIANNLYEYPISSNSYDIILSGQVIEHIPKVWIWIKEVSRICKPGGLVITINPVSWPYHEAPVDCWRIYPEGMKALYDEGGLEVILSIWESLEVPNFRRYIWGLSTDALSGVKGKIRHIANLLLGKLGWPVERSYDTITIGRKK